MAGSVEIERKFLVGKLSTGLRKSRGVRIVQGYLPLRGEEMEVRLRRKGSEYFITFKSGAGARRGEIELPISRKIFAQLWRFTTDGRIAKRRHKVSHENVCIEVDVYEGPHRGLITAEVEFDSMEECRAFRPPGWLGREITDESAYSNHVLARRGRLTARQKQK